MSLYKPQGWKCGKKVAAYSPEFTIVALICLHVIYKYKYDENPWGNFWIWLDDKPKKSIMWQNKNQSNSERAYIKGTSPWQFFFFE